MHSTRPLLIVCLFLGVAASFAWPAAAESPRSPLAVATGQSFTQFVEKLRSAVAANGMGIVAEACADCGARTVLGKEIPGNRVIMIFHPRYAVRLLESNVDAGIEAPLRLYLTEEGDGTARLIYERPSRTFERYDGKELAELAAELDLVVERIVQQAMLD